MYKRQPNGGKANEEQSNWMEHQSAPVSYTHLIMIITIQIQEIHMIPMEIKMCIRDRIRELETQSKMASP